MIWLEFDLREINSTYWSLSQDLRLEKRSKREKYKMSAKMFLAECNESSRDGRQSKQH